MEKEIVIEEIISMLKECEDLDIIDLIYLLLLKVDSKD